MINKSIKIVLWDYGGVLSQSPIKKFLDFEKKFNIPTNTIIKINSFNKFNNAWARFEKGLISLDEFSILFKKEAKTFNIEHIDTVELLKCLDVELNKDMIKLLDEVSKKYSCVCLTNNFKAIKSNNFSNITKYFSQIFESSKINMRKPEVEVYKYVLERLNVTAGEILFIDDLGINLKPAKELGFDTHKFVDTNSTIEYINNKLKL